MGKTEYEKGQAGNHVWGKQGGGGTSEYVGQQKDPQLERHEDRQRNKQTGRRVNIQKDRQERERQGDEPTSQEDMQEKILEKRQKEM
jgi:hypothetical protein